MKQQEQPKFTSSSFCASAALTLTGCGAGANRPAACAGEFTACGACGTCGGFTNGCGNCTPGAGASAIIAKFA